jgi:hypothetical protein
MMLFYCGRYAGMVTGFAVNARGGEIVLYSGGTNAWPFTGNCVVRTPWMTRPHLYAQIVCPD